MTTPLLPVDYFNGDADGLCALQQLRLTEPGPNVLVTGVKRDIHLAGHCLPPPGSRVTILDVGFKTNRRDVERMLEQGCTVRYFDHHKPGEIPTHPRLEVHIDEDPKVCTSLIMDRHLGGAHRAWAVVGAFGDNMRASATAAAAELGLTDQALDKLRLLGELLNYNGYGEDLADLHFHPADLFRHLHPFDDPLEFLAQSPQAQTLAEGYEADLKEADGRAPDLDEAVGRVFRYPGEAWARRVMGVQANRLANEKPDGATALCVDNADGSLRISIRAPLNRPQGAGDLCGQFPTGGGRAGAGGINALPPSDYPRFLEAFRAAFPQ